MVVYDELSYKENSMTIEVEKNIPIPPEKKRNVYPYKVMEIGESFFIPTGKIQIVCNANYRTGKQLNKKFIARKDKEGVRVWRTE
jgi:hypothetical protein